ncbi:mediator of RNA polymerase II transcription subunit 29 isoform X2 [Tursiops truncatus]|uniref:mediator of RNA polymerase II transcription subunit 29 isoform X2 n=1 Tax=Tursiops truncatus TaxID=9739 RepID=UPI003CCF301F
MAASQQQASAASSAASVSGPGSAGGSGPQQQPQPPTQLVGPAQSGLLQQQQQDFDPVQRYKMLIPQLKESLQTLMKVAAQNLIQNTNIDNGQKSSDGPIQRFDKCLEEFYALCDQLELCLPPSLTPSSLTACPIRSTWRSSKPRLPVPRTFTLPCWTAPTRSQARRLHRLRARGAPCELAGLGAGLAVEEGMKSGLKAAVSLIFLPAHCGWRQQGAAEASRERPGRGLASAGCLLSSLAEGGLWIVPVGDLFQGLSPNLAWLWNPDWVPLPQSFLDSVPVWGWSLSCSFF